MGYARVFTFEVVKILKSNIKFYQHINGALKLYLFLYGVK